LPLFAPPGQRLYGPAAKEGISLPFGKEGVKGRVEMKEEL